VVVLNIVLIRVTLTRIDKKKVIKLLFQLNKN